MLFCPGTQSVVQNRPPNTRSSTRYTQIGSVSSAAGKRALSTIKRRMTRGGREEKKASGGTKLIEVRLAEEKLNHRAALEQPGGSLTSRHNSSERSTVRAPFSHLARMPKIETVSCRSRGCRSRNPERRETLFLATTFLSPRPLASIGIRVVCAISSLDRKRSENTKKEILSERDFVSAKRELCLVDQTRDAYLDITRHKMVNEIKRHGNKYTYTHNFAKNNK